MNLSKMKVGARLGLGFALVLAFLAIITVVGIWRMAQIQDRLDHVVRVNAVATRLVIDMRNNVENVSDLKILTLMSEPSDMEPELARINKELKAYQDADAKLTTLYAQDATPEEKALLA